MKESNEQPKKIHEFQCPHSLRYAGDKVRYYKRAPSRDTLPFSPPFHLLPRHTMSRHLRILPFNLREKRGDLLNLAHARVPVEEQLASIRRHDLLINY